MSRNALLLLYRTVSEKRITSATMVSYWTVHPDKTKKCFTDIICSDVVLSLNINDSNVFNKINKILQKWKNCVMLNLNAIQKRFFYDEENCQWFEVWTLAYALAVAS